MRHGCYKYMPNTLYSVEKVPQTLKLLGFVVLALTWHDTAIYEEPPS